MAVAVDLEALDGGYAVSLLPVDQPAPDWVLGEGFSNISYCDDELSIVCRNDRVPPDVEHEGGWTAIKLTGAFAFDETGVVLSVVRPLSEDGLGVFVVSTFKRDCLLVKSTDLAQAKTALTAAGHRFGSLAKNG